ncbi:hypothetical protein [Nevskia ramosa]|uniref:hypothetical protein n=1 Tax=Nevskia ramosa TaxID=64002 RepID=UPI003D0D3DD4
MNQDMIERFNVRLQRHGETFDVCNGAIDPTRVDTDDRGKGFAARFEFRVSADEIFIREDVFVIEHSSYYLNTRAFFIWERKRDSSWTFTHYDSFQKIYDEEECLGSDQAAEWLDQWLMAREQAYSENSDDSDLYC